MVMKCEVVFLFTKRGVGSLRPLCPISGGMICAVTCVFDGSGANWRLVGECYIYGLMDGEATSMHGITVREIQLV